MARAGKTDIDYYIDDRLKKSLDEKVLPALTKDDKDYVIAVDGKEGAGKSFFAFQIAKYVDSTFDLSRVTFTAEEFKQAIFKAKKGQAIVFDEAFTGLSSRSSLSSINRYLVSLMMQMRQKNLFVIIVLPTFFLLDKYVALFRTRALIHVYETGGRRGYFKVYNSKTKKYLFLIGKKTYSYMPNKIRTRFKGRFYGIFALGDKTVEEEYRKKKEEALESVEKNPMNASQIKYMEQRNILIYLLRKKLGLTYIQLSNLFADYDLDISSVQVGDICVKFGDKEIGNIYKLKKTLEKERDKEKLEELTEETTEDEEENNDNVEEISDNKLFEEENDEDDSDFI